MRLGYALLTEEHSAPELVRNGRRAEELGMRFLSISDHYHPWIGRQGESPFVWSVIGGLASVTESVELATFVTCPTVRIHPAIIAQAAATSATMMPGRFLLGLGSGEALNEHILGDHWPPPSTRIDMLGEAVDVIRELWTGEEVTFYGSFYTVEQARLYSLPDEPPPILIAATGRKAASLAADNDGLVAVAPDPDLVAQLRGAGGRGQRAYGQINVAWDVNMTAARKRAHEYWPQSALGSGVAWEIATPRLFEALVEGVSEDTAAEALVTCSEPDQLVEALRNYEEAGFDVVTIHQVGPNQLEFLEFLGQEVLPHFES